MKPGIKRSHVGATPPIEHSHTLAKETGLSHTTEIQVPDIGDFSDIPVIEIAVSTGDIVNEGDTLISIESDKATIDVPASASGRVVELKVAENDLVSAGSVILIIETVEPKDTPLAIPPSHTESPTLSAPSEGSYDSDTTVLKTASNAATENSTKRAAPTATDTPAYASPSVRRFARELGVDVNEINGTGPKNRITQSDIKHTVKAKLSSPDQNTSHGVNLAYGLPDWPRVDHASYGPIERIPLSRIGRISGPALARNALIIPHVTTFDQSDVTDLEAFREKLNSNVRNSSATHSDAKITMLTFAIKAVVTALKKFPNFNTSLEGNDLIHKHYWNIGVAVNTTGGLVVPVVKDADQKGLRVIAEEIADLAEQARKGKLATADMQGATFTISSLGGIGGTNFTPIINAPEVAILGMARSEIRPVWDESEFQPRRIQPLSLSFDHRVVDGVAAAYFLAHIANVLNDFRLISE